ncbi:hypothetical protein D3C78_520430 [compost metagenome]
MVDGAEVVQGVLVAQRAARQLLGHAGLPDGAERGAVRHVAVDPLVAGAAAQGPVADVPAGLGEQRAAQRLDVRAEVVALAALAVVQAVDVVAVTELADLLVLEVRTPDQIAGGAADAWQGAVHRRAQTVDLGLAFRCDDTGVGAPVEREEARLLLAPVAFYLQALAEQVMVGVVEVHCLVVGKRLVAELQALDRHGLAVAHAGGVAGVLLVAVVLQ